MMPFPPFTAFFYGGLVNEGAVVNTLMLSYATMGVITLMWGLVGYSLAFAPSIASGVVGDLSLAASIFGNQARAIGAPTITEHTYMVFQVCRCARRVRVSALSAWCRARGRNSMRFVVSRFRTQSLSPSLCVAVFPIFAAHVRHHHRRHYLGRRRAEDQVSAGEVQRTLSFVRARARLLCWGVDLSQNFCEQLSLLCVVELFCELLSTVLLLSLSLLLRCCRFQWFLLFVAIWHVLVYCPLAHWIFYANGWLFTYGSIDFAGTYVRSRTTLRRFSAAALDVVSRRRSYLGLTVA